MSTTTTDARAAGHASVPHRQLLGWSVTMTGLGLYGALLFSACFTAMSLVPFSIGIPLVLVCLAPMRALANYYRRWAGFMLGTAVRDPYRPQTEGNSLARIKSVLGDPATWRDLGWLIVNGTVGVILAALPVSLFLGGIFYLSYPFLWWVTPSSVFASPFGFFTIDTLAGTWVMIPLALLSFALWAATDRALLGAVARLAGSMLKRREVWIRVPASPV